MKGLIKDRPDWCPRERDCQYVYNVGCICVGCLSYMRARHPWRNAYSLCFGEGSSVCVQTKDILGLFKCLQMAARFEREHGGAKPDLTKDY